MADTSKIPDKTPLKFVIENKKKEMYVCPSFHLSGKVTFDVKLTTWLNTVVQEITWDTIRLFNDEHKTKIRNRVAFETNHDTLIPIFGFSNFIFLFDSNARISVEITCTQNIPIEVNPKCKADSIVDHIVDQTRLPMVMILPKDIVVPIQKIRHKAKHRHKHRYFTYEARFEPKDVVHMTKCYFQVFNGRTNVLCRKPFKFFLYINGYLFCERHSIHMPLTDNRLSFDLYKDISELKFVNDISSVVMSFSFLPEDCCYLKLTSLNCNSFN